MVPHDPWLHLRMVRREQEEVLQRAERERLLRGAAPRTPLTPAVRRLVGGWLIRAGLRVAGQYHGGPGLSFPANT